MFICVIGFLMVFNCKETLFLNNLFVMGKLLGIDLCAMLRFGGPF